MTLRNLVRERTSKTEQRRFILFNQPSSSCSSYNPALKRGFFLSRVISTFLYNAGSAQSRGGWGGWCFYKLIDSALGRSHRPWPLLLLSHVCLSFRKTQVSSNHEPLRAESTSLRQSHQSGPLQTQVVANLWNHLVCCLLLTKKKKKRHTWLMLFITERQQTATCGVVYAFIIHT